MQTAVLQAAHLDQVIQALKAKGYLVIGPRREDFAIVYDELNSAEDLPRGLIDEQDKGVYRLHPSHDSRYFGYTVAANAWKKFLNPPRQLLWRAERNNGQLRFIPQSDAAPALAFIGVRSCELHGIFIQDSVFTQHQYRDETYQQRRQQLFTVAVNCTRSAATCFCVSMATGPKVTLPSDITLTEIIEAGEHYFILDAGSENGRGIAAQLTLHPAQAQQLALAEARIDDARQQMQAGPRFFNNDDTRDLLFRNLESAAWDEVAERCLSCANCTLACPTCFCSAVEDTTDLSGEHAERWQRWDSCFNSDFSYIHGGAVRQTTRSRYRQWMTHKLGSWIDQFGHSGCVGCGRCISWCPVGIDITEQLQQLREQESIEVKVT